jgi:hypothetical protein
VDDLALHCHLAPVGRIENVVGKWQLVLVLLVLGLQVLHELQASLLERLRLAVDLLLDLVHVYALH